MPLAASSIGTAVGAVVDPVTISGPVAPPRIVAVNVVASGAGASTIFTFGNVRIISIAARRTWLARSFSVGSVPSTVNGCRNTPFGPVTTSILFGVVTAAVLLT